MGSLADMVARAWEDMMRTCPDPLRSFNRDLYFDGAGKKLTYRQELDEREINSYGEIIPRKYRVLRNLRALGPRRAKDLKPFVWEPRRDRRQNKERRG